MIVDVDSVDTDVDVVSGFDVFSFLLPNNLNHMALTPELNLNGGVMIFYMIPTQWQK